MNLQIKSVRQRVNKTQKEFGESLGVSRDTLASYESGRVVPSKTFIQLLCTTYNVNENWLRTGLGEMYAQSSEDVIGKIADNFGLGVYGRKILDVYLNMSDEQRAYIEKFLLSILEIAQKENVEPSVDLLLNKQADEFAEMAREQFLKEKKADAKASSAKESEVG